jgi:Ca2+-binding EF-hand superfamily protein
VVDFAELVKLGAKSAGRDEVDLLFKVVDTSGKGYLTPEDMKNAFSQVEQSLEIKVFMTPNDIILPF